MFLFFDTETTGLPTNWSAPASDTKNWPRMVQLAYLLYTIDGTLIESQSYIVKPSGYTIPTNVSQIHGITTEHAILEGVDINIILDIFQTAISKATVLVAHNITFDEKIVGCEYFRTTGSNPLSKKPSFCTMTNVDVVSYCALPPLKYGSYKWPKLSELHQKLFNFSFDEAHNAAVDITATAKCFWELKSRGIIKLDIQNNSTTYKSIDTSNNKSSDSAQTISFRQKLGEYCHNNNFKEIPLAAKAEAIMHLEFKFKQIGDTQNIDYEFECLRVFFTKSEEKNPLNELNEIQKQFIFEVKQEIIQEHKGFSLFTDEKNKTIEDKIGLLEVLSLVKANDTKIYSDLVITLYYYYLSKYEDFIPSDKKPKKMEELKKDDYSNISIKAQESHAKLDTIINNFSSDTKKLMELGIAESVYNLVISLSKELNIIKNEIGINHKMYIQDSAKVVRGATTLLTKWIKSNPSNISNEACKLAFSEIAKIETDESTKSWFINIKISFDSLIQQSAPKSGCFIATMAYGDYNHPQVIYLREFRDNRLSKAFIGKLFIQLYYYISPTIVSLCKENTHIVAASRFLLDKFIDNHLKKNKQ